MNIDILLIIKIVSVGTLYVRLFYILVITLYVIFKPQEQRHKTLFYPKSELQYQSRSYNVACLMLPATLNSTEFQTERHEQMLRLFLNTASTLVSTQNDTRIRTELF
jgi:hypothetical protein